MWNKFSSLKLWLFMRIVTAINLDKRLVSIYEVWKKMTIYDILELWHLKS